MLGGGADMAEVVITAVSAHPAAKPARSKAEQRMYDPRPRKRSPPIEAPDGDSRNVRQS